MIEYESYYNLLIALCFQDNDNSFNNSVIVVYDATDNDRPVCIFSKAKYCAEFLDKTTSDITTCISRKRLVKGKYRIERVML